MSRLGVYMSVYLSQPLYDHLEAVAGRSGEKVPTVIRDCLLEACPEDVREAARKLHAKKRPDKMTSKPQPDPPPPKPTFEQLVEKHRDRVIEFSARAYLPSQIASVTKLPNDVIQHILNTPSLPKKGTPK